jgi:excisionase family DNA binding protein
MGKGNAQMTSWAAGRLMTAQEVARVVGRSDKEIYKMAACGEMPCVRITGRMVRFEPDDLEKWLASKRRLRMSRGEGY